MKNIILIVFTFIFLIGCSEQTNSPEEIYKRHYSDECIILDIKNKEIDIKTALIDFNEINICDKSKKNINKKVNFYFEKNEWKIKNIEVIN